MTRKLITVEEARAMLPEVGDRLERVPTKAKEPHAKRRMAPRPCTVIQVHHEHLWYRVRFDNGMTECYKVPDREG